MTSTDVGEMTKSPGTTVTPLSKKARPLKRGETRQKREERGRKKHDWAVIRMEFVEGIPEPGANEDDDRTFLTQKALAERHGVDYSYLRKRVTNERWNEHKQQYAIRVTRERQKRRALTLAKNAAGFDERSFKVGELGMMLVATRLSEIGQEVQARKNFRDQAVQQLQAGIAVDKKDLYSAVYATELERLASAADRFQTIGQRALGTDVQRMELTGPDGMPLDMSTTVVNIHNEMLRDDPERAAAVMQAMADAGLIPPEVFDAAVDEDDEDEEDDEVLEGEVIEQQVQQAS